MGVVASMVVAFMLSQASGELPGAPDSTFEQRWDAMVFRQQMKKESGQISEPRHEQKHSEKYRRPARSATGCRYGHKVYHGKSWRCRR